MEQNFDLNFSGKEIESLLIRFKNLINSKKITNKLPENLNLEIRETNKKIDRLSSFVNLSTYVDGGDYIDENLCWDLINLVENGSFEDTSNWTIWETSGITNKYSKFGSSSFAIENGEGLASTPIPTPMIGHTYYGREYVKTNGELTGLENRHFDCRFEINSSNIPPEVAHVFGYNKGNYPDWTMISGNVTITELNADNYIIRTFVVNGTTSIWIDGIMLIDLTECFGEGNEPTKEWCDENIPYFEGGKRGYIDFNNCIHLISDLHKITILSDIGGWDLGYANIIIEDTKYTTESKEIYVPDGTVIKCEVYGASSMGANDSGTGLIIINGQEIVSAYGCTKTYDYIVKDNVTIHLDENGGFASSRYGVITIDEETV